VQLLDNRNRAFILSFLLPNPKVTAATGYNSHFEQHS
jgi:hypothetical protein